jgi:hypothetical protein
MVVFMPATMQVNEIPEKVCTILSQEPEINKCTSKAEENAFINWQNYVTPAHYTAFVQQHGLGK